MIRNLADARQLCRCAGGARWTPAGSRRGRGPITGGAWLVIGPSGGCRGHQHGSQGMPHGALPKAVAVCGARRCAACDAERTGCSCIEPGARLLAAGRRRRGHITRPSSAAAVPCPNAGSLPERDHSRRSRYGAAARARPPARSSGALGACRAMSAVDAADSRRRMHVQRLAALTALDAPSRSRAARRVTVIAYAEP